MQNFHKVNIGLAISTPIPAVYTGNGQATLGRLSADWHRRRTNLQVPTNYNMIDVQADGLSVADARNVVVRRVLAHDPRPEYLFFLDWDVLPEFDAVRKLLYRAQTMPEYSIYCGVYCVKQKGGAEPLIYTDFGVGPYWHWAVGDLILGTKIRACHMGLTLIRTSLFDQVEPDEEGRWFASPQAARYEDGFFKSERGSEDIWFCKRAGDQLGDDFKILVDTSVLAGHEDAMGNRYGLPRNCEPMLRSWLGKQWRKPKIALDLGAGEQDRKWPGHKTITTDLREGDGVDFVMDSRWLNFPDAYFDLVASSHHLEHIPRADQRRVWEEMSRVLKPSGAMEHIVPNLEWAAAKIAAREIDEHVYNVLYGAQRAHGYGDLLNTHFFGYTPDVAYQMATKYGGLKKVEIETYEDNPSLGYNLVLRGVKRGRLTSDNRRRAKKSARASKKQRARPGVRAEKNPPKKRTAATKKKRNAKPVRR